MKPQDKCFTVQVTSVRARPEISLQQTETEGKPDDQVICCGYVPVVLMKMFGPLIFADIRIRADAESCEWVVERENIKSLHWEEVARIPGQMPEEFHE